MAKQKTEKAEELVVIIPEEINALAVLIPEDKKKQSMAVLYDALQNLNEKKAEIDSLKVNNIGDTVEMGLAKDLRIDLKNKRGAIFKDLDLFRSNVQGEMSEYVLQDKLLLKTRQIIEIMYKSAEKEAEHKEKFLERAAAEERLNKNKKRLEDAQKYNPDATIEMVEALTDDIYDFFLKSLKGKYEAEQAELVKQKEAEELEAKKDELHKVRLSSINHLGQFFDVDSFFGEMSAEEWKTTVSDLQAKKDAFDKEQEAIQAENDRLQREAAKTEKLAKEKAELRGKRENELRPYIIFIRDYATLIEKPEADYQKELSDIKKGAKLHYEAENVKALKEEADKQALAKKNEELQKQISAEKQRKEDEEAKRIADEQNTLKQAEKAKEMPVKDQLLKWIDNMSIEEMPVKNDLAANITFRFKGFKSWAKSEITKLK